jgi:hypothetical protein
MSKRENDNVGGKGANKKAKYYVSGEFAWRLTSSELLPTLLPTEIIRQWPKC